MLDREESGRIAELVIEASKADETEVTIRGYRNALTRFAENTIHQNTSESVLSILVRVVKDGKAGEAWTNSPDDSSIRELVDRAVEMAGLLPMGVELPPLPGPQEYQNVDAYDPGSHPDVLGPEERAAAVAEAVETCGNEGLKGAGFFSNNCWSLAIANSKGLFAFHRSSDVTFSVTAMSEDSSGWAEKSSHTASDISPKELALKAIGKAKLGRTPREIPVGEYTVVLEPEATADLLQFLAEGFDALAFDEGRSFLKDKLGEPIAGSSVSLYSDPYHPLHMGCPFDSEGTPTKKVALIEKGVAANLVYDRITARKHGVEPTGHVHSGRGLYGAYPSYMVMEGGSSTLEEMIRSVDRGILVTRFHYENMVDPMKVIVTGMTRDGTFWIEDGRIRSGIRNLRFNESVLEVLNRIEMASEPALANGIVAPAVKVSRFRFTSGTEF